MATVITFPMDRCGRSAGAADRGTGSASIIILPVVRIERYDEPALKPEPTTASGGRKRRRRSPRS
jgi:hypothetical protein